MSLSIEYCRDQPLEAGEAEGGARDTTMSRPRREANAASRGFAALAQEGAAVPRLRGADEFAVYRARQAGLPLRKRSLFRLIDLFAGAGGMSLGFGRAFGHVFQPVWANDFNSYACRTYVANFGSHCYEGDIVDLLESNDVSIPEADVVIGGPPCQGFSLLNKNRRDDPRKALWLPYLDIVERSGASVFLMENVPQLLGSEEHNHILARAKEMGFQVASAKLLAADYGVPQRRARAFLLGCRTADPASVFPPRPTHCAPRDGQGTLFSSEPESDLAMRDWRTVRDAIGDLPQPVGTELRRDVGAPLDLHFGRNPTPISLERYRMVPEGGNRFDLRTDEKDLRPSCWVRKDSGGTDLFGRLWWARPSVTIRTEFFKPEKGRYLHPDQHRPITHREAARLQTFPDSFRFEGSKSEIAKQIGNAVPPLLAARLADCVYALLRNAAS
jgi:DNA (cytosine-5)-methyltransferase 1